MSVPQPRAALGAASRTRGQGLVGAGIFAIVLILGLLWAKWLPYADKSATLLHTRTWKGGPIFSTAGSSGSAPSIAGARDFWQAYFTSVWKAALVAIVVAALLESVVPRRWLISTLSRRSWWGRGVAAGALALPSMMCTCCTAPVAIGLRRSGAPLNATLAYWLANPLLNPAVLAFVGLTLPWRFVAVRIAVGAALVVAGSALAARWARPAIAGSEQAPPVKLLSGQDAWSGLPRRFAHSLTRYVMILVPEYALVVLVTGGLSGWLSDFDGLDRIAGPASLLLVGLVGAVLVVPTGGEIPVIIGLLAAGTSDGVAGVLLITLPALSLPSIVMVGRALSWRSVGALAGLVVLGGVVAGGLMAAA